MKPENHIEKPSITEKFSSKQKLLAVVGMAAAFGGSLLFYNSSKNNPSETTTTTPIEQSTPNIIESNNNQTSQPSVDKVESPKKSDSKKDKTDKNTSYKYCPDIKAVECTIQYKDPGSGETVLTTPNKTPEGNNENVIIFLGFGKLIDDYGMTFDQINALRSEFKSYSKSLEKPIKELSIKLKSVETTIDPNTADVINKFTVTINRESTLSAEVEYFGIDNPTLKLYNPEDNTQVFSSK